MADKITVGGLDFTATDVQIAGHWTYKCASLHLYLSHTPLESVKWEVMLNHRGFSEETLKKYASRGGDTPEEALKSWFAAWTVRAPVRMQKLTEELALMKAYDEELQKSIVFPPQEKTAAELKVELAEMQAKYDALLAGR